MKTMSTVLSNAIDFRHAAGRKPMLQRLIPSGVLTAVASIAMAVALSSSSSFAFTLSSPSLTEPVIKADGVQQVWWHWHHGWGIGPVHWHHWHHWHHWY